MADAQSSQIQSMDPTNDIPLEELLIEAVRKRRPLWDNTTPLHKNVRVLVYCWQQVAKELCLNERAIKKKWKGLRDYFFRQVRILERNDSNNPDSNVSKCLWPLYDRLTFLMHTRKTKADFCDYKMDTEERELLDEVSEHDKRQRVGLETIVYHVPPSPPEIRIPESVSIPTPIIVLENGPEQKTTEQSKRSLLKNQNSKRKPNTPQETIVQPETTTKIMCEPPPLRVFAPNLLKKTDSPLLIRSEQSQPLPSKKSKSTSENDPKQSDPSDSETDADLHFFKSLLPFMRKLPLKDKLRVRNGIQDLILGELDAIRTKNNYKTMIHRASVYGNQSTSIDVDAGFNEESRRNRPVIVKEEFEDDPLQFDVVSRNLTFEDDDNYCDG